MTLCCGTSRDTVRNHAAIVFKTAFEIAASGCMFNVLSQINLQQLT